MCCSRIVSPPTHFLSHFLLPLPVRQAPFSLPASPAPLSLPNYCFSLSLDQSGASVRQGETPAHLCIVTKLRTNKCNTVYTAKQILYSTHFCICEMGIISRILWRTCTQSRAPHPSLGTLVSLCSPDWPVKHGQQSPQKVLLSYVLSGEYGHVLVVQAFSKSPWTPKWK